MHSLAVETKLSLIDENEEKISLRRQCELIGANRSSYYYEAHPRTITPEFCEEIRRKLDFWSTEEPAWGTKTLVPLLKKEGYDISCELIRKLRIEMGLETIYPHKNTSKADKNARKMPYLLRNLRNSGMIWLPNLVWAIDITYISMNHGHMYLTAIIDWATRFIVGWELSDTLETAPVLDAVKMANRNFGYPAIQNSDQGSQFTSDEYKDYLRKIGTLQSMDSKGRWADNVVIERWFRTLKTTNIYLNEYISPRDLRIGIAKFVERYNYVRPHRSINNMTPGEYYYSFWG